MSHDNTKLAIIFALFAALFYSIMGVLVKIAEQTFPNEVVVFFRQLISAALFFPFFLIGKKPKAKFKTNHFSLHLLRAFSSISATYCLFYAIEYLPLVDALLLSYTRPLFLPLVAYFWLDKRWNKNVWIGLCTGFLGVILILKPSEKVFNLASLIGLAAGLFGAVAFTAIRRLTKVESSDKILLFYLLLSLPITVLPLVTTWTPFTLNQFGLLCLVGIVGMLYQMMLTRAYQYAKTYKVGSVLYSTVVFAAIFDWMMTGQYLDYVSIVGIALIFVGSFATLKGQSKVN
ncbi:MAG: DMT family transporter [Simkaniaceae bacterium]